MNLRNRVLTFAVLALMGTCAMNSLGLLASSGAGPSQAVATGWTGGWVQFVDPIETAFSLDVPRGWTVKGGLDRKGFSDYRLMVDMQSSDGKTDVRLGDAAVPVAYAFPTQFHPRDGEPDDLGAQAQILYARFRTGQDFAALYAQARFRSVRQNVVWQSAPEPAPVKDDPPQENGASQNLWSVGQVMYKCDTSAGPRIAYVYAKTKIAASNLWKVSMLASFFAPPDQVPVARSIILRGSESVKLNPQWVEYQNKMDAEGLQYQRARQQQRMADLQQQVRQFEARLKAQQAQFQQFDNVIVGITPTINPLTGQSLEVWTGPKTQYWQNGNGQVVNSDRAPAAGWTQLQVQPQ
jgi:hypothetical protein